MFFKKQKKVWKYKTSKIESFSSINDTNMPTAYSYSVHIQTSSLDQIRLSKEFQKYQDGSLLKITLDNVKVSYIFSVKSENFDKEIKDSKQISISQRVQNHLCNSPRSSVPVSEYLTIEFIKEDQINKLRNIKLLFRNLNIGLKDRYLIKKGLIGKIVNNNDIEKNDYGEFKVQINDQCGQITEDTIVKFKSASSFYIYFVEISQEIFDQNNHSEELNFELLSQKFKHYIEKILKEEVYSEIRIVCYGRLFYPQFNSLEHLRLYCAKQKINYNCYQINYVGQIFKDYYSYKDISIPANKKKILEIFDNLVLEFVKQINWSINETQYKKLYYINQYAIQSIPGELSKSIDSNFLEALNLFLSPKIVKEIKTTSGITGINVLVFTCSDGIYNVETYFYEFTQKLLEDQFIILKLINFHSKVPLKDIIIRYPDYKFIKTEKNQFQFKLQLLEKNRLQAFLVDNSKEHKYDNLLRVCLSKLLEDQQIKGNKSKEQVFVHLQNLKKDNKIFNFTQTYKGIINYVDKKKYCNLKEFSNEEIKQQFQEFKDILDQCFHLCGHSIHYLPTKIKQNYLECKNQIKMTTFENFVITNDRPNILQDSEMVLEMLEELNQIYQQERAQQQQAEYLYNEIAMQNQKSLVSTDRKVSLVIEEPLQSKKLKALMNKSIIKKKSLPGQNMFNAKELKMNSIEDTDLENLQQNTCYIYKENAHLDDIICSLSYQGLVLDKSDDNNTTIMQKSNYYAIISNMLDKYSVMIKMPLKFLKIFDDVKKISQNYAHRFIYQYCIYNSFRNVYQNKKIEFYDSEQFQPTVLIDQYLNDSSLNQIIESSKETVQTYSYIVYYNNQDFADAKILESFKKEFDNFIEALNKKLSPLTNNQSKPIDLNQQDNFLFVDLKKIANSDIKETIVMTYTKNFPYDEAFEITIYSFFTTPIIIQSFYLLIKNEVNKFNLQIKKINLKIDSQNNIDSTTNLYYERQLDLKEMKQLFNYVISLKFFYIYKNDHKNCCQKFIVFDSITGIFLDFQTQQIKIIESNLFQIHDEDDTNLMSQKLQSIQDYINNFFIKQLINNMVIIKDIIHQLIPKLSYKQRKGENGKIGCLGGSFEYTGAPFYVADTLLKSGADMSFIFCPEEAGIPIKTYSPDIIVIPYKDKLNEDMYNWLKSLYFNIIGPGMGRNSKIDFGELLDNLEDQSILGDADFSWYLMQDEKMYKDKLKKLKNIIITPNIIEFKRMYKHAFNDEFEFSVLDDFIDKLDNKEDVIKVQKNDQIKELQKFYDYFDNDNFYLLLKYKSDFIVGKNGHYVVQNKGGLKRCGGQGDILSGLSTLMSYWADKNKIQKENALIAASFIVRQSSKKSFEKHKLGLVANDIIQDLKETMNEYYDEITKQQQLIKIQQ